LKAFLSTTWAFSTEYSLGTRAVLSSSRLQSKDFLVMDTPHWGFYDSRRLLEFRVSLLKS